MTLVRRAERCRRYRWCWWCWWCRWSGHLGFGRCDANVTTSRRTKRWQVGERAAVVLPWLGVVAREANVPSKLE